MARTSRPTSFALPTVAAMSASAAPVSPTCLDCLTFPNGQQSLVEIDLWTLKCKGRLAGCTASETTGRLHTTDVFIGSRSVKAATKHDTFSR